MKKHCISATQYLEIKIVCTFTTNQHPTQHISTINNIYIKLLSQKQQTCTLWSCQFSFNINSAEEKHTSYFTSEVITPRSVLEWCTICLSIWALAEHRFVPAAGVAKQCWCRASAMCVNSLRLLSHKEFGITSIRHTVSEVIVRSWLQLVDAIWTISVALLK